MSTYTFKFAAEDWELEQIHRLNYEAFVEEIPQHAPNPERRLVDQFHDQNTYAIAVCEGQVVAMLALRSTRPFSLDKKLPDLDRYLPANRSMCEMRLFYIKPEHRNGKVVRGLIELVGEYGISNGHDLGLISGTTRQQRLYKHIGFVPFGPLVGTGDALFQPMYLTLGAAHQQTPWVRALTQQRERNPALAEKVAGLRRDGARRAPAPTVLPEPLHPPANFMPGPVNIPARVRAAFTRDPISHRSDQFLADVQETKEILCKLTGARRVELLFGSGTLANEVVGAQTARMGQPGVVLSNGEFGSRLLDHARRWQLEHTEVHAEWGKPFDYTEIERLLDRSPHLAWLWCVHSETSTGILNDLPRLVALCNKRDLRLCVDCISSIGATPLDLSEVYFATGTSGKALASFSGLGMVFYQHEVAPDPEALPRYLDLGYYAASDGVPFTVASNLLYALREALHGFDSRSFETTAATAAKLRAELRSRGYHIVADDTHASPAVTSIELPSEVDSRWIGDQLQQLGYLLSYKSGYLVRRNWIQICLMGEVPVANLPGLLEALDTLVSLARVRSLESAA